MKENKKNLKVYLLGMLTVGIGIGLTTVVADTIINSTNVSYKTTTVKAALDDLYGLTADDIWQKVWPVGSIYTSVSPTSPATLFGGTWEEFGTGKSLVGIDTSDSDFNTVEKTGGSKTKTLAIGNLPAHTHSVNINTNGAGSHSHSVAAVNAGNQSANHTHSVAAFNTEATAPTDSYVSYNNAANLAPRCSYTGAAESYTILALTTTRSHTHKVPAHNTGGQSANHTHTVPAHNTGTVANHTHNVNGDTGSTGSGTALNVQNPYITVYMWKRTA